MQQPKHTCLSGACITHCISTDRESVSTSAQATLAFNNQLKSGCGTAPSRFCRVRLLLRRDRSPFFRCSVALRVTKDLLVRPYAVCTPVIGS